MSRGLARVRSRGPTRHPWLAGLVIVVVACALESVPGFPGHPQAALLTDLGLSDTDAALHTALPFVGGGPDRPCAALASRFEVGNHLLRNDRLGWYASIWPSYQALNALYVDSLFPGRPSCRNDFVQTLAAIDGRYWDTSYRGPPPAFDQGPHAFHLHSDLPRVDDSLWMGLAAMRGYLMTGHPVLLRRAAAVFRLAVRDWDARRGGVYWEYRGPGATDDDKAVVSNAPAVVLGAALYATTNDPAFLVWSTRMEQWLQDNLLDPSTGLYADRTTRSRVVRVIFTYNQGIMVGALTALASVAPDRYPMSQAVDLARRSIAYFGAHRSYGQPAFDAIWARNVLWTAGQSHDAAFAAQARAAVDLAVKAEPRSPSGLLDTASEAALRALAALPASDDAELSLVRGGGH